jgi:hypothetical protein
MNSPKFDVNNLKIASPCPVAWETMNGDERKRFCDMCSLNVYNVSEMTRDEAEKFIGNAEGRICARIYRRADGTVITKDCPVGLRAYRKRAARFAGAAFSTILGLFSIGYGQTSQEKHQDVVLAAELKISAPRDQNGKTGLSGVITDVNGAVVPNVAVTITMEGSSDSETTRTNSDGKFAFIELRPGKYTLEVEAEYGYRGVLVKDLNIEEGKLTGLTIAVQVDSVTETVGVLADMKVGAEITSDMLTNLPVRPIPPLALPKKP